MKFKSQICTSIEQSKALLALGLKKETADMFWWDNGYGSCAVISRPAEKEDYEYGKVIPAWSLLRLVSALMNNGISILFIDNIVVIEKYKVFEKSYEFWDDVYDNICDAIEWLIKEGYFNKEYLVDQEAIEEHCKGVLEYLDYIRKED